MDGAEEGVQELIVTRGRAATLEGEQPFVQRGDVDLELVDVRRQELPGELLPR